MDETGMPVPMITGAAEGNRRVHDYNTRIRCGSRLGLRVPSEGIELDRQPLSVPFYSLEVNADDFLHGSLALSGGVDQPPIALNEQVQAVCLKCLIDEGVFDLKVAPHVIERLANFWKFHAVAATNGR